MKDIKSMVIRLAILLVILAGGFSILINVFDVIVKAVLWILFIENAETGLSFYSETIVKAIVEGLVLLFAGALGISKKNPFVSFVTFFLGFIMCVCLYFIKQYIFWIMLFMFVALLGLTSYLLVRKSKENRRKAINKTNLEGGEENGTI